MPAPSSTSLSALTSSNGRPPDPFSLWSLVSASDGHDGGTELHRLAGGHGAHHGRRGSRHRHHLQVLGHLPLQQPPAHLPLLPGFLPEHHLDVVSGCFRCCCCLFVSLKGGNRSEGAGWSENVENVQIFPSTDFTCLFYKYSCKRILLFFFSSVALNVSSSRCS